MDHVPDILARVSKGADVLARSVHRHRKDEGTVYARLPQQARPSSVSDEGTSWRFAGSIREADGWRCQGPFPGG